MNVSKFIENQIKIEIPFWSSDFTRKKVIKIKNKEEKRDNDWGSKVVEVVEEIKKYTDIIIIR